MPPLKRRRDIFNTYLDDTQWARRVGFQRELSRWVEDELSNDRDIMIEIDRRRDLATDSL